MRQHEKTYLNKIKYSSDQEFLKKAFSIATADSYKDVVLSRIKDQDFLKNIFKTNNKPRLREIAVSNIVDQDYLLKVITDPGSISFRHKAALNITCKNIKKTILQTVPYDVKLFLIFFDSVKEEDDVVFHCLNKCRSGKIWNTILPQIKSRSLLISLKKYILENEYIEKKAYDDITSDKIAAGIDNRLNRIPLSLDFILGN